MPRSLRWTRKVVKLTAIGGLIAVMLTFAGCGSRGSEVDDGVVWMFGEAGLAIISWPVVDAAGNMFVIAGTDATPLQQPFSNPENEMFEYFEVSSVVLVSVAPDGTKRWQQVLAQAQVVGKQAPWRPAVSPSGDVWTCWAGELRRWGNDGALRWFAPGRCRTTVTNVWTIQPALAHDGTFYDIEDVTADPGPGLVPELRATSSDGVSLWSRILGEARIEGGDFSSDLGTVVGGVAITADGRVVSGCDTCAIGQNSVASFAASDGTPAVLYSTWINPPSTDGIVYSAPVLADDVVWIVLDGVVPRLLHSVYTDGSAEAREGGLHPPLVSDDAVVHWDSSIARVLWGETYLDPEAFPGYVVAPVALLRSNELLAGYSTAHYGRGCFEDCGLFIVDASGTVIWQHDRVAPGIPIPVVGDGYLVYVDYEYRLVKIDAPVEGLADGPWPILGGNPQGTRSAEGK